MPLKPRLPLLVSTVARHQFLNNFPADTNTVGQQTLPDLRLAVATTAAGMSDADVHEPCLAADSSLRTICSTADLVAYKAGSTNAKQPALQANGSETPIIKDERVLQLDAFAKYAVAFSRMSRSI